MARKPRTSVSLSVPANLTEANAVLFRLGAIDRSITAVESEFAAAVALLREKADLAITPLAEEGKQLEKGFAVFATDHRSTLLVGTEKSVKLSGGTFGWRWTPLKVHTGKGGDARALATVKKDPALEQYVRTEESLDKEALLRDRPAITGIKYTQTENFFIEPDPSINDPEASTNVVRLVVKG